MKTQVIEDHNGAPAGVFIPIEEWEKIKSQYPGIEMADEDLAPWEKDLIDSRLNAIAENPARLQPIETLYDELKRTM